ncbi:MAG: hypothetical protein AAGF19_00790 [Pseudomonadota bacterium]
MRRHFKPIAAAVLSLSLLGASGVQGPALAQDMSTDESTMRQSGLAIAAGLVIVASVATQGTVGAELSLPAVDLLAQAAGADLPFTVTGVDTVGEVVKVALDLGSESAETAAPLVLDYAADSFAKAGALAETQGAPLVEGASLVSKEIVRFAGDEALVVAYGLFTSDDATQGLAYVLTEIGEELFGTSIVNAP